MVSGCDSYFVNDKVSLSWQIASNDLDMGAAQASYMHARFQRADYFHTIASYDFILGKRDVL